MHKTIIIVMLTLAVFLPGLAGCQAGSTTDQAPAPLHVTAIETFLGDIPQNVAGSRARVDTLIPIGIDPHEFQPTPQDVVKLVQAQVMSQFLHLLLGGVRRQEEPHRIARMVQDHEDHDAHDQEDDAALQDALEEIAQHLCST